MFKKIDIEPCIPSWFLRNAHSQTIMGHYLPSPQLNSRGVQWKISLTDGDALIAHYIEGTSDTIVYLFHGLGGHAFSDYMQRTAKVCQRLNHSILLVNHRGCGAGMGYAKGVYHSGSGDDISEVLKYTKKLYPSKKHIAIGFSLSGNALLLLLSGKCGSERPDAAIAINAPINLQSTTTSLANKFNRIYDLRFVWQCRQRLRLLRKHKLLDDGNHTNNYEIPWLATLMQVDDCYTAPAGGFANKEDYYTTCSTYQTLTTIVTPTLIITSEDDPFVPFEHYRRAEYSKHVILHNESRGGHMGYITNRKTPLGTHRWLDYALFEYISSI